MIEIFRQAMIFFRNIGLILANKGGLKKDKQNSLLRDYFLFKLLNLLPKTLTSKIKALNFLGSNLAFFDLETTTALIEAIFIENEYFFNPKNKKPKIFDLGSNLGLSVIYFKTLWPNAAIGAYEADPTTAKVLSKNVESYRFRKVGVNNLAVTSRTGMVDFFVDKKAAGSPLASTNPLRINTKAMIRVKSVRLSDLLGEKIDFLKIDIEGGEFEVLKDLDRTGKIKLIGQMSIEYHHHINNRLDDLAGFLKILEKNNFGYQIHAGQNTPFELKTFEDIQIHAYNKDNR